VSLSVRANGKYTVWAEPTFVRAELVEAQPPFDRLRANG